jgi:hypothetical protein
MSEAIKKGLKFHQPLLFAGLLQIILQHILAQIAGRAMQ